MIPDELVQAAAEALMADHEWDAMAEANREVALQLTEKDARIALQAAFAKLPECEEAEEVATIALSRAKVLHTSSREQALVVIGDLARKFGDKS